MEVLEMVDKIKRETFYSWFLSNSFGRWSANNNRGQITIWKQK